MQDYVDISIRWRDHPKYTYNKLIEDDLIEVIVQKLEMILFTTQGEIYGDSNCGCNLTYYLWETNMSNDNIKEIVTEQISTYIPELITIGYTLDLEMYEGDLRDILFLNFKIKGYNIEFVFE